MHRTQDEWIALFNQKKAWWRHSGNRLQKHALLHSGAHSDGYFMSKIVTSDPIICWEIAQDMIEIMLAGGKIDFSEIRCIIGAPTGGTNLAKTIFETRQFPNACFVKMDKEDSGGTKRIFFPGGTVPEGALTLVIEDITTSGDSAKNTCKVITDAGGYVHKCIPTILNRSGEEQLNGFDIIPLVFQPMTNWPADKCPRCAEGSEAIRPKGTEDSWDLLNLIPEAAPAA